jgi:hypothetical protein
MGNSKQKSLAKSRVVILCTMLLITIITCVSTYSYLKHNLENIHVFDDSYITLQFASNFFKYGGITYDGTSFLRGATSPLHIIFISLIGLFLEIETASLVIGSTFFILSSLLVYLWTLAIYKNKTVALLAGILTATSGWLIFDALNGLETTTFIFFSLLTFYLFHICGSKPFYVIPLFLSILTRPEGWFIAGALWLWEGMTYLRAKKKNILKRIFIAQCLLILLLSPYLLSAFYYTGTLLPGTATSKAIFFGEVGIPLINKAGCLKNGLSLFFITFLYPVPLFVFPLILFARKVISLGYLFLYLSLFCLFYFFLFPCSLKHYWCRYQHIFIPFIIIALSGGTYELVSMCKQKFLKIGMVVVICFCLAYNQMVSFQSVKNIYLNQIGCTKKTLLDLAYWIKNNTPKDSSIALHDIGVVGYYSDRKIVDLVGLINPEIKKYFLDKNEKKLLPFKEREIITYLKIKKPDYVVLFPDWDRFFNLLQPGNNKHFQLAYTTPPLFPIDTRYNVYKCDWTP